MIQKIRSRDSFHNREYYSFYYRDSKICTLSLSPDVHMHVHMCMHA